MTLFLDSLERLKEIHAEVGGLYPGESARRQPVHVVYGGAQLFTAETFTKVGRLARQAWTDYAPTAAFLANALGGEAAAVHAQVQAKLKREPIEDYRIDFEDGYGSRPDEEEDRDAIRAATELARAGAAGDLPPFCGFRVKSLSLETAARSLRTLQLFLNTLLDQTGGKLPEGFVVTLPKVVVADQAHIFSQALAAIERERGLAERALKFETMIELPQLLLNREGRSELPRLIEASLGRLAAVHFGAYDYTAACDVAASEQSLDHPACDLARQMIKLAFAGTGIALADGATHIMPIGPHRALPGAGPALSPAQVEENTHVVLEAWRLSYRNIRHGLRQGFYQGWDLHPAQIPIRFVATYAFFRAALPAAAARLRNFLDRAAQASLVGNVFDDAASGQGLIAFFARGLSCGALTEADLVPSGLTLETLKTRSFSEIVRIRGAQSKGVSAVNRS